MAELTFSAGELSQLKKLIKVLRDFALDAPEADCLGYEDRMFLWQIWDVLYSSRRALGRYGIDWRDVQDELLH